MGWCKVALAAAGVVALAGIAALLIVIIYQLQRIAGPELRTGMLAKQPAPPEIGVVELGGGRKRNWHLDRNSHRLTPDGRLVHV